MPAPAPVQEGEILAGKYKIERVLATGGMGVVVAAIHQQLEQRVALKFLLPEGMGNEASVTRFIREARAAVRLRSEHVARVLDVGTAEDGAPYIVMEYLEGSDLSSVVASSSELSIASAVTYVLQASEAIAEAHALGIVHRDLKPSNLFLTQRADGTACVKVLDFGISKVSDLNMTNTQTLVGTPYYMAPELLHSSKNSSARSDIYALGMILYELLTGDVAWRRDTLPELCFAIMNEPLAPLSTRRQDVPPSLNAVIERALARSPDERFQTLAELATALKDFSPLGPASETRIHRILGVTERPAGAPVPASPGGGLEAGVAGPPSARFTAPAATPSSRRVASETETQEEDSAEPSGLPKRGGSVVWRAVAAIGIVGGVLLAIAAVVTLTRARPASSSSSSSSSSSPGGALVVPPPASVDMPPDLSVSSPPRTSAPAASAATAVASVRPAPTAQPASTPKAGSAGGRPAASASAHPALTPPATPEIDLGPRR